MTVMYDVWYLCIVVCSYSYKRKWISNNVSNILTTYYHIEYHISYIIILKLYYYTSHKN